MADTTITVTEGYSVTQHGNLIKIEPGATIDIVGADGNEAPNCVSTNATYEEGATASLVGTSSSDPDGTINSYQWVQKQGSTVTLTSADQATATFTTPAAGQELVFFLTITDDNGARSMDVCRITTTPSTGQSPPIAVAPADFSETELEAVSLDGTGSSGTDSAIVGYEWTQTAGTPTVTLTDETTNTASFTAPDIISSTDLTFSLTVTDGNANTDNDSVIVTINPIPTSYPYIPQSDSRLIYISDTGNDGTGVNTTLAAVTDPFDPQITIYPYLTIAAALAEARSGYPDWILFKRGDTWTNETLGINSGRSATEKSFLTFYGTTGARPIIEIDRTNGLNTGASNFAIYGLDIYSYTRDPDNGSYTESAAGGIGLRFVGGGSNILIEETIVRWFNSNIVVQSYNGSMSNFTMRRSIVLNSYASPSVGHNQGLFVKEVDGVLIEENFLDYNGWNADITDAEATMYNHNIYLQFDNVGDNVIVRDNIITRASSHGIHGRPGGLYEDNLLVENSIGLQLGYRNHPIASTTLVHAKDNVILSGKLMDPLEIYSQDTTAVWGLEIDWDAVSAGATVTVENNIVANRKSSTGSTMGISNRSQVTYIDNVVYDWKATEDMTDGAWAHPEAKIPEYMTSIGETNTLDAFLTIQRTRGLSEWETKHTSSQANTYFRAGFDR